MLTLRHATYKGRATIQRCLARVAIRWLAPLVLFASCLAAAADPAKILRIALPRGIGYKAHPVLLGEWIYVDINARVRCSNLPC